MIVFELAIALILSFVILVQPYLGIVFVAASLPVAEVLPEIPYITSVVPLFGLVTLVSFLLNRSKEHKMGTFRFVNVHILGLLLIGWIFGTNPEAAWFGADRNWIFTFIQLWMLLWLAGELLDTPEKQRILMWVYSIFAIVSALIAIREGGRGEGITQSLREMGLAPGINTAARYFVIAMVLLIYLRRITPNRFMRLFTTGGAIITIFGLFFTVSRTGILLLFAAIGLLVLLQPGMKYRFQLIILVLATAFVLWLFSNNIVDIVISIAPSILQGTDTAGLRYALWKAGWRMWLAHPFVGVGIGMFSIQLRNYALGLPIPPIYLGLVAHNMYVQALAETGSIGFGLFALLLIKSLQNLWPGRKISDPNVALLRNVWFVVFVVMLLGGITKTDQSDKMLWLMMGISVLFHDQLKLEKLKKPAIKEAKPLQVRKDISRYLPRTIRNEKYD
jgi:O-antigen ligase